MMKLCFIIFVAYLICKRNENMKQFWNGFVPIICTFVPVLALLFVQEHLSAMLITAVILFVLLVIGGARYIHMGLAGAGGITMAMMYVFSTEFRRKRLLIFFDPWQDALGTGWQIIQSLYAISSRRYLWCRFRSRRSKIYVYFGTTK